MWQSKDKHSLLCLELKSGQNHEAQMSAIVFATAPINQASLITLNKGFRYQLI